MSEAESAAEALNSEFRTVFPLPHHGGLGKVYGDPFAARGDVVVVREECVDDLVDAFRQAYRTLRKAQRLAQ